MEVVPNILGMHLLSFGNIKNSMSFKLDIKKHTDSYFSIKDLNHDLDISEHKWSFVYDSILENVTAVYFDGNRLNYSDNELNSTINYLSEKILIDNNDHWNILLKLKLSSVMFNRKLVSNLWSYYEYPALIFLKDELHENILIKRLENKNMLASICDTIDGAYITYQGIEYDVLWLRKSKDMTFDFEEKNI